MRRVRIHQVLYEEVVLLPHSVAFECAGTRRPMIFARHHKEIELLVCLDQCGHATLEYVSAEVEVDVVAAVIGALVPGERI